MYNRVIKQALSQAGTVFHYHSIGLIIMPSGMIFPCLPKQCKTILMDTVIKRVRNWWDYRGNLIVSFLSLAVSNSSIMHFKVLFKHNVSNFLIHLWVHQTDFYLKWFPSEYFAKLSVLNKIIIIITEWTASDGHLPVDFAVFSWFSHVTCAKDPFHHCFCKNKLLSVDYKFRSDFFF